MTNSLNNFTWHFYSFIIDATKICFFQEQGQLFQEYKCFDQSCGGQAVKECGLSKMNLHFNQILGLCADRKIEYYEHVEVEYTRPDKKIGKRWELQKLDGTFAEVVEKLGIKVFGSRRETFLMHQLKKLLSTEARHEMRKSLSDNDVIAYSDFSKELALLVPEEIKSAAFGASNTTLQIIPQVYEMSVLPPSAPRNLSFDSSLSFDHPELLGGSRLSEYEVHIQDPETSDWLLFHKIPIKPLSPDPDLAVADKLSSLNGSFHIRVAARNRAGLGSTAELIVNVEGNVRLINFLFENTAYLI